MKTSAKSRGACRVAVIWIDWYPYHVARFAGLSDALPDQVVGIELVGGIGVHAGLKFREPLPEDLAVETLMPLKSWGEVNKPALAFRLWRKLSELKPEVVLVPGYYTLPGVAAAVWARVHGARSVLMAETTAGDHVRVGWREGVKSLVVRCLFDWAVVGGQRHIEYLKALGFAEDRITGFYDVVNNAFFRAGTRLLREGRGRDSSLFDRFGFLYVGRLAEEKNVVNLLTSWITYRNEGGDWPLVLVGDGPEAERLRSQANASKYASDVSFPGLRSSSELLPFYAAAGCFVLPSTREPWGLVVNEAMAAGLPVLVSDRCGCAPDLVQPGINGFIFGPSDTAALTGLLHRVATLSQQERQRMCAASANTIDRFSPANFGGSVRAIADWARSGRPASQLEGSRG